MSSNPSKSQFPIWEFLNQPVFDPATPLILNPKQFWQHSRITLLERCWSLTRDDHNKYPNDKYPHA